MKIENYKRAKEIQDRMLEIAGNLKQLMGAKNGCNYKLEFTPAGSFNPVIANMDDKELIRKLVDAHIESAKNELDELKAEFEKL